MDKHDSILSEKRTHLAQKRTRLAHERTVMSYIRTASTVTLFGLAFLGFSKETWDFFFISGVCSISFGTILFIIAFERWFTHSKEIEKIENFFGRIIKFKN